ncbi:MAG: RNA 2'-phosphotransferase [Verrucomicrobiales bacterium]
MNSIRKKGLVRGGRDHVHLSADEDTATKVGMRHGKPVVLSVRAKEMAESGSMFFTDRNLLIQGFLSGRRSCRV